MDKPTTRAFEKLEKRENLIRMTRLAFTQGRITEEVFRKRTAAIIDQYKLTDREQRAYEQFIRQQRKRNSK